MKSGVSRKVRMGASLFTALAVSAISMTAPNSSTQVQAAEAQVQSAQTEVQGNGRATCRIYGTRYRTYVKGYTYTCYQVQAAVKCSNGNWYYDPTPAKVSYAYCPSGYYAVRGAVRGRFFNSSWSPWLYF
jgi:hypothetical protein